VCNLLGDRTGHALYFARELHLGHRLELLKIGGKNVNLRPAVIAMIDANILALHIMLVQSGPRDSVEVEELLLILGVVVFDQIRVVLPLRQESSLVEPPQCKTGREGSLPRYPTPSSPTLHTDRTGDA
jgi:hypothetical protein